MSESKNLPIAPSPEEYDLLGIIIIYSKQMHVGSSSYLLVPCEGINHTAAAGEYWASFEYFLGQQQKDYLRLHRYVVGSRQLCTRRYQNIGGGG